MKETVACCSAQGWWDSRFVLKGTSASYAPDRTFHTKHIRLILSIDIQREKLHGRCISQLQAISSGAQQMIFDAVDMKIQSVKWNGKKIPFVHSNGKLTITNKIPFKENEKSSVEIEYDLSKPRLGLYFIKPNKFYPQRPTQVWTQGEDEYARYWFPCHDAPHERVTSEVLVTVPKGFVAVSNGRLVKTVQGSKTSTYHYLQDIPHATYLVTLTAGRFSLLKDSWRGTPVLYYCEKGREKETQRAFGKTPKMMEFFSSFIGTRYPYAKYAQIAAADFIYGGMENTSATTQTDAALLDERVSLDYTSDELVAHELAHQWFGDYLTCKDWSHAWLNESFATYFDALFKRFDKGEDEFLYAIRQNADIYFQEDKDHYRRPISTKIFRRPSDLFDRHLYEKGSVVLYMLHRLLGENLFRKSIVTYVRKNKSRAVETADLINAIEEATGRNIRRFFDQWIFGSGHPELKIRQWWDSRRKELVLRISQVHSQSTDTQLFDIKTEISAFTSKGEKRFSVFIDKKSHIFRFPLAEQPSLVLFDPDHHILKRVDFPKSLRMWLTQLAKDKNPLGRIDALQVLGRTGGPKVVEALRKTILSDSFWGVSADAARALGSLGTEEAASALLHLLDVAEHPKIRRSIYTALRSFKEKSIANEIAKRFSSEKSYFVEAEGLRLIGALEHPRAEQLLKEALKKESWNDVIRQAALEGFSMNKSADWIPLLLTYTKQGHSQKLRLAALRCLSQFGSESDRLQPILLKLLNDPFPLMQIASVRLLHHMGDERAIPALKKITVGHFDGRLKRLAEEAMERITKGFE